MNEIEQNDYKGMEMNEMEYNVFNLGKGMEMKRMKCN